MDIAQSTLSTGGNSIILSTPNGVGNFFHRTWVGSEEDENGFNPIRLHWSVHPERNQEWRDNQETLLGPKGVHKSVIVILFLLVIRLSTLNFYNSIKNHSVKNH